MPVSKIHSATFIGLKAHLIEIEVDVTPSDKPALVIVGLPDAAVRESKDRVQTALKNVGVSLNCVHCTINLAPGGLKKNGALFDLPIALALMHAMGKLPKAPLEHYLTLGELALSGEVRPFRGALSLATLACSKKKEGLLICQRNAQEAATLQHIDVYGIKHLKEAMAFLQNPQSVPPTKQPDLSYCSTVTHRGPDFADILGQAPLKRAAEIAAAGGHNFLISGPPGAGKTMIAKAFPSILPPLSLEEAIEVTTIHSFAHPVKEAEPLITTPPFRSPHHTTSHTAMVGGGSIPRPGEISLAHRGVLFLDELPEFSRTTLEVLRQPLEEGEVTVSRAQGHATFPSRFIFIAAMNPCPCGFLGHPQKPCSDTALQIERYKKKISGPLLDRIDLTLQAAPADYEALSQKGEEEPSLEVQKRVIEARKRQEKRWGKGKTNSDALPQILKQKLSSPCHALLKEAMEHLGLSARGYNRLLKVAQTLADLDHQEALKEEHLLEALSYRTS